MNGGNCTSPGVCSCPVGFQGRHCEGGTHLCNIHTCHVSCSTNRRFTGICSEKCENGGKCVQKDTCECSKGFYGLRCEYCDYNI